MSNLPEEISRYDVETTLAQVYAINPAGAQLMYIAYANGLCAAIAARHPFQPGNEYDFEVRVTLPNKEPIVLSAHIERLIGDVGGSCICHLSNYGEAGQDYYAMFHFSTEYGVGALVRAAQGIVRVDNPSGCLLPEKTYRLVEEHLELD